MEQINLIFESVKIACYIISILIIVLSIVPCEDNSIEGNADQVELSLQKIPSASHLNDFCSPFCQCACCTTITVSNFLIYSINLSANGEFDYAAHLPGEIIEIPLSIWQPPKIS